MDEGCIASGGMCVDILRANLKDKNAFPLNTVNLDRKIEGANGLALCRGSESEKCCECYKLLESDSGKRKGGLARQETTFNKCCIT